MAFVITENDFSRQSTFTYSNAKDLANLINKLKRSNFQVFEKILSHNRFYLDVEKIKSIGGLCTTGIELTHYIAKEFNDFVSKFLNVNLNDNDKKYIITKNNSSESYHIIFNYGTDIITMEHIITLFKSRYTWGQIIDNLIYCIGGLFKCVNSIKPRNAIRDILTKDSYHDIIYSDWKTDEETLLNSLIGNLQDCKIFSNLTISDESEITLYNYEELNINKLEFKEKNGKLEMILPPSANIEVNKSAGKKNKLEFCTSETYKESNIKDLAIKNLLIDSLNSVTTSHMMRLTVRCYDQEEIQQLKYFFKSSSQMARKLDSYSVKNGTTNLLEILNVYDEYGNIVKESENENLLFDVLSSAEGKYFIKAGESFKKLDVHMVNPEEELLENRKTYSVGKIRLFCEEIKKSIIKYIRDIFFLENPELKNILNDERKLCVAKSKEQLLANDKINVYVEKYKGDLLFFDAGILKYNKDYKPDCNIPLFLIASEKFTVNCFKIMKEITSGHGFVIVEKLFLEICPYIWG